MTIRAFDVDRDAEFVAAVYSWSDDFRWTAQDVRNNVSRFPAHKPMMRLVAEIDGQHAGFARVCEIAPNPQGAFQCEALVVPEHQRKGIARELVGELEGFAREKAARCTIFLVNERFEGSMVAARALGYEAKTRYYQSFINPAEFDDACFAGLIAGLVGEGYEFLALSELAVNDETDRAYYEAVHGSDTDTPYMDYFGWPDFEDYRTMTMNSQWFDRKGVFLARIDGEIVGVSTVNKGAEFNGEMYVDYTGVLEPHRNKGLATALKVYATNYAKSLGATKLRTENNDGNPAMRKVNKRIGFDERPGMWMVVKEL